MNNRKVITIFFLSLIFASFYPFTLKAELNSIKTSNENLSTSMSIFKIAIKEDYGEDIMPHSNAEKFARTDITNMLEYLGFKISDERFDAVLNLTIKGEPIAARYYNYGLLYTGARVEGRLSLKGKGVQKSFHFSGVSKPTPTGHPDTSETPADAPFYKAWDVSDFIPKFIDMLSNTLNIPKARVIHSAMKWQTDQMLEKLTNQLAECGEAGIVELIDIVKTKNDIKMNGVRRMSAKLFGKSGTDDPKIFEALISVLQDKSDEQSVRCAVLSSFVKTKNTSVVPALIKLITENAEKNWNSYDKLGWGEYVPCSCIKK